MKSNISVYMKYRQNLQKDGWAVAKGIFSSEEVTQLRADAYNARCLDGDLLSIPCFEHIVYNERIIKLVSELLEGRITYFGESRLLVESINGRKGGAFHRDNPDRYDSNGPDWRSTYNVVRIGIYLQNHKNFSEGIGFFSGSHKNPEIKSNNPYGKHHLTGHFVKVTNAPIEPGDIVIWYLTTMHVGYPKRLKFLKYNGAIARGSGKNWFFNNTIYKRLPSFLTNPVGQERIILHCAYGKEGSPDTQRYIDYCKRRAFAVNRWQHSNYSKDVLKRINESEVSLIDMTKQIPEINMDEVGDHVELPY